MVRGMGNGIFRCEQERVDQSRKPFDLNHGRQPRTSIWSLRAIQVVSAHRASHLVVAAGAIWWVGDAAMACNCAGAEDDWQ
jgi:hypothetical protein